MPYKTVLKGDFLMFTSCDVQSYNLHSLTVALVSVPAKHSVTFKAENMAEKLEWMGKLRYCIGNAQGASVKGEAQFDSSQRFGSTSDTTGVHHSP